MGRNMPKIALVDDDRHILTSVSMALEAEGYQTQTYTDGVAALQGLEDNPPDMAIFDIKMPRMDGMELLRRLRQKSDLAGRFFSLRRMTRSMNCSVSRWGPTISFAEAVLATPAGRARQGGPASGTERAKALKSIVEKLSKIIERGKAR